MCGRPGQRTVVCAAVSTTCPAESRFVVVRTFMSTCVRGAGPCALCGVAVWRALVCSAVSGGARWTRARREIAFDFRPDGARLGCVHANLTRTNRTETPIPLGKHD